MQPQPTPPANHMKTRNRKKIELIGGSGCSKSESCFSCPAARCTYQPGEEWKKAKKGG